jgi:FkbM family methyltransferase
MGKVLDKFYARYENPGVLSIILDRGMPIDWAIEAGCHDGTDTLRIASLPNMKAIFAFEPDSVAADIAEAKFLGLSKMITLVRSALWSKPGIVDMYSPTGKPGDGNSIFNFRAESKNHTKKLEASFPCTTIDLEIKAYSSSGLLWLDVEGVPHFVLQGAASNLENIAIAQIEVEMHKMSNFRTGSFFQVHKIMRSSNFKLYRAPIHPGFFGDVIYIRQEALSTIEKFQSSILTFLMHLLHRFIYPALNKP